MEIDTALDRVERFITEDGGVDVTAVTDAAAPWLPAPWGAILAGAAGLATTVHQRQRGRGHLAALVGAIDRTKADQPALGEAFHDAGDSIRSRTPSGTKRLIDAIRK